MVIILDNFFKSIIHFIWVERMRVRYSLKIERINKSIEAKQIGLDRLERKSAEAFLQSIGANHRDLRWHKAYARATGRKDARYVPENFFYSFLEPLMNPVDRLWMAADKNVYDMLSWPKQPETIARVIRGKLYDENFAPIEIEAIVAAAMKHKEVVVKPSIDSGGGKGVRFCQASALTSEITLRATEDLIVQAPVRPHSSTSVFHAHSLNTIRIMTYRNSKNEIVHLSSVFRIGRSGARVDNQATGGIVCGIEPGGVLSAKAYNKAFNAIYTHPDTGVTFAGCRLPHYISALKAVIEAHQKSPWYDLASWDVAIDEEGEPVLVEVNVKEQELNFHQLCNGPLFSNHTDDLIAGLKTYKA